MHAQETEFERCRSKCNGAYEFLRGEQMKLLRSPSLGNLSAPPCGEHLLGNAVHCCKLEHFGLPEVLGFGRTALFKNFLPPIFLCPDFVACQGGRGRTWSFGANQTTIGSGARAFIRRLVMTTIPPIVTATGEIKKLLLLSRTPHLMLMLEPVLLKPGPHRQWQHQLQRPSILQRQNVT